MDVTSTAMGSREGITRIAVCSGIEGLAAMLEARLRVENMEREVGTSLEVIDLSDEFVKGHAGRVKLGESGAEILLADPSRAASLLFPPLQQHGSSTSGEEGETEELSSLKWYQSTWAGVDTLFKAMNKSPGTPQPPNVTLTRLGGVLGPAMAEYVFAFILAQERRLAELATAQQNKQWASAGYSYRPLSQLCLGIIGVGDIGGTILQVAQSFGMRVLGLVRDPSKHHQQSSTTTTRCRYFSSSKPDEMKEFMANSDYIINALPSTPHTTRMLTADYFSWCQQENGDIARKKREVYFINVGRGDVTTEADLLEALEQEYITGAVLDVFQEEPLPKASPLWAHPRCKITPHVAAISRPDDVVHVFCDNLRRYLQQGAPSLQYIVDWRKGY
ncbi:D-2-hydroxyacid dehydrogenase [Balamuthia mandrillaris]